MKEKMKCPFAYFGFILSKFGQNSPGQILVWLSMASLVPGARGGYVLLHNGYRYQKNRQRNTDIHWRCWRADCRAPLKTNAFDMEEENPVIHVLNVSQFSDRNPFSA